MRQTFAIVRLPVWLVMLASIPLSHLTLSIHSDGRNCTQAWQSEREGLVTKEIGRQRNRSERLPPSLGLEPSRLL